MCEAAQFKLGPRLCIFFVLLCYRGVTAAILWDAFRDSLCKDHSEHDPELAAKLALIKIYRSICRQGSSLADHGLLVVQYDKTELGSELITYGVNHQKSVVEE